MNLFHLEGGIAFLFVLSFVFLLVVVHPPARAAEFFGERKLLESAGEQTLPGNVTVQGTLSTQGKMSAPFIDLTPTPPGSFQPAPGRLYFNNDDGKLYFYNNSSTLRSMDADSASANDVSCTGCVDIANETSGSLPSTRVSGTFTAAKITGGTFGSGNFVFPANLTVDTNTLFVDATNNRVGIGTTSPGARLDVKLGSDTDYLRIQRNSATGRAQLVLATEAAAEQWRIGMTGSGSTDFAFWGGTANNLVLERGGNSYFQGGYVGIGTASPQSTLDVAGTLNVSGASAALPATTTVGGTQVSTTASDYGRSGVSSTLYEGATALSSKYALQSTTVSAGTGLSGGGSLAANRTISADTTYLQRRVSGTCAAGSSIRVVNSDGTVGCEIDTDTDTNTQCEDQTCSILRLDDGTNTYNRLDTVAQAGAADALYWGNQRVTTEDIDSVDDTVSGSELDGVFSTTGLLKRTGAATYTTTADNSTNWNTAYTDRLKWDGGSSGLNAATGRTSLGLANSATITAASTNTASQIVLRDASGDFSAGTITATLSGNASTATALAANPANCPSGQYPLGIAADGTVEGCTVAGGYWTKTGSDIYYNSGNVGIGTTSPNNILDIKDGSARTGTHATGRPLYVTGNISASSNGIEFRHYNGTQGIGFGYNTIYATGSNGSQDLNILPRGTGKVGIGTTSPGALLDVAGDMDIDGNLRKPSGSLYLNAAGAGANLVLQTGGTDKLTVLSGGNVGIGTSSPGVKLEVNGGLHVGTARNANALTSSFSFHDPDGATYTYTQLIEEGWGGGHGLLWNGYKYNAGGSGGIRLTGKTRYANDVGAYNSGAAMISFEGNGGTMYFDISPASTGKDTDINWGTPKMVIQRGGNVGIGTTSPASKLDVEGSGASNGITLGDGNQAQVYWDGTNSRLVIKVT